jgi:rSAM/selenodomain-associated transferase 2
VASTVEHRCIGRVSIVVPVLDEQDAVVGLLDHLAAHFSACEVVVVDGGSRDATVERATGRARVITAPRGRGPQLNAGAAAARGDVLWFVHVDTRPDPSALAGIHRALADPAVVGGGCRIRFDRGGPALAWLRVTSNLRARHLHWIFGDQAMFVRREVFEHVGSFPELPIMEDLEMSRRLARQGRLVLLRSGCTASARRFVDQGTLRMIVVMQYLKALYFLGVAPDRIAERYARARRPAAPGWRPLAVIADLERRTRPVDPRFAAALARRWAELPEVARTPGQVLGRHGVGCEGTHGVFPRCDLACTPCYHSRGANRVRVDGAHTLAEVEAQMQLLHAQRGPWAHAQLIGGEVTLLDPDDHAAALETMQRWGREPMSMTHGDVDEDRIRRLALDARGRRRFRRLSFAAHFDSSMFGRRGLPRPPDEAALDPHRRRFVAIFTRLRREHGVRSFLAHNMTVTPANLDQVPHVVRSGAAAGFSMLSFQPAAFLGDDRRWREDYRAHTADEVWARIEEGAGARLDPHVFENGDVRCNRTAYGLLVDARWIPLLDLDEPADVAVRGAFFRRFGPVSFTGASGAVCAARVARVVAAHPGVVPVALGWAHRFLRRAGYGPLARAAVRGRVRPLTFVMHQFMDAVDVTPAWEATRRGEWSDDPRVRGTQERLAACHYAMAHPEDGTLVPACVQHALLDPAENEALQRLLPIVATTSRHRGRVADAGSEET